MRKLLFSVLVGGLIFGAGLGASVEHYFSRPVTVMSPICSKKDRKIPDENIPIIPDDPQDQQKL